MHGQIGCTELITIRSFEISDVGPGEIAFEPTWSPSRHALAFDRFDHPSDGGRGSIVVSHPGDPFTGTIDPDVTDLEEKLRRVAHAYLVALNKRLLDFGRDEGLGLPDGWLEALDPNRLSLGLFGWLPIDPPFSNPGELDELGLQLSSHRLLRKRQVAIEAKGDKGSNTGEDTSVVLVGAETVPSSTGPRPINSDFGLQVFIHFRDDDMRRFAITSMTANLPYGRYSTWLGLVCGAGSAAFNATQSLFSMMRTATKKFGQSPTKHVPEGEDTPSEAPVFEFLGAVIGGQSEKIAALYQLEPEVSYDRLRLIRLDVAGNDEGIFEFEVSGKGIGAERRDIFKTPYRFAVTITIDLLAKAITPIVKPVLKSVLVTNAAVFEQDPPSSRDLERLHAELDRYDWSARRPTRSEEELDAFRRRGVVGDAGTLQLETEDFAVRNCPDFARADPDDHNTKEVELQPGVWPPVRADDHSAISAFYNCRSVFVLMRGFGIDPAPYFIATVRPFDVFYRSGIRPGPGKSGQTINARVSLEPNEPPASIDGAPCHMQMHMALANFSHRARRVPDNQAPTWAEPLGIATSERWIWHEFGHVFIAGRFGQLELPFVHSAGDALAAVAADPLSRLAEPRDRFENFRGYTYPFVFLTRRHDRSVCKGWSWGGTFHRSIIESPDISRSELKGYISEQILSSTLFRLYRILGGDTVDVEDGGPDYGTRLTASDVTLFFIIRGIELFGLLPARAEELENTLIQADLSLTSPLLTRLQHDQQPPAYSWQGGLAHKVVRWAFEAQGMHLPGPNHIRNAPGDPPPVDIYIQDGRPIEEPTEGGIVRHGSGGYVPVSLDWAGLPRWHAGALPDVDFIVSVKNRGRMDATQVSARAWFGLIEGTSETRGWDRTAVIDWSPPFDLTPAYLTIGTNDGDEGELSVAGAQPHGPNATHIVLLVEVTCPDDRANSDPDAALPCAVSVAGAPPAMPRQVADLVANDNNLGLWMRRL